MSKDKGGSLPFQRVRSRDRSDPGFRLPGKTLRWVSAKQTEVNMDRPWVVLRMSNMPKELVDHLNAVNPGVFSHGDTVRRGDLTLAYCTDDAAAERRRELNELAQQEKARVYGQPTRNVKIYENEAEKVGADLFRKSE